MPSLPGDFSPSHANRLRTLAHQRGGTSAYAGVHFDRQRKRWTAAISDSSRGVRSTVHLGRFKVEREAAAVYDLALIALGYPPLNFPASLYAGVVIPDELRMMLGQLRNPLA